MNRLKKKAPRWRREQKKRASDRKKSRVYLGLSFIFLIVFLVIFNFLWQKSKDSIWNGDGRIGIVTLGKESLDLTVLLPNQEKIIFFKAPLNTIGETPFGFGEYQMGNVYALGKLENEGGRLLTRTTQNNFSVFVSGFRASGKSNLTWWDELRLTWYETMVASRKVQVDLVEEQVLEKDSLPDGSEVWRIKPFLLDELINHELFDEKLLSEELEVAVINASEGVGVAANVSRLIRNIGSDVTVVSNLDLIEESIIQVASEKILDSYTVEVLGDIFNIGTIEIVENSEFRADIVVIIGKDYLSLK